MTIPARYGGKAKTQMVEIMNMVHELDSHDGGSGKEL